VWTFRSTTSDIGSSTTGQVGTVILATNYNPDQPLFTDKKTMMEYYGAASVKATESLLSGVECDAKKLSGSSGKYVRTNPVLSNTDLKSYDAGVFQVAVANTPTAYANLSLGELWVSYTVVLRKPKFYSTLGFGIGRDLFVSGGSETAALLMGPQVSLLNGLQNNIGCAVTLTSNTMKITFPANYSGNIAISFNSETSGGGTCFVWTIATAWVTSTTLAGNVKAIKDIYGAGAASADTPDYESICPSLTSATTPTGQNKLTYILHVNVAQASLGVDNSVTIVTAITGIGSANTQSSLEITEYNTYGRLLSLPAPVLVNPSGVVTVPA
jgi:hypothetical protein